MASRNRFQELPERFQLNFEGKPRHVGVEVEFAAVTARDAAKIVQELYGGELHILDAHRYELTGTDLGDFRCELDFQYAHVTPADQDGMSRFSTEFRTAFRELIGDVSALVAPCEIVCPPLELKDLWRLEALRESLHRVGAAGTGEGLLYAFGVHLNPDIVSSDADYLVRMLKAYILMSDLLRDEIQVDTTRWLLKFADPFPPDYQKLVLSEDYWPRVETLIDDYLAYNASRNRELDMLPLFSWIDADRIQAALDDSRIKGRPTFHYRLPNACLDDTQWSLASEWNRWCRVEHLAANAEQLADVSAAWFDNNATLMSPRWADRLKELL